jgi:hypothetical protein
VRVRRAPGEQKSGAIDQDRGPLAQDALDLAEGGMQLRQPLERAVQALPVESQQPRGLGADELVVDA